LIYIEPKMGNIQIFSWNTKYPVYPTFVSSPKANSNGTYEQYNFLLPNNFKPQNTYALMDPPFIKVCVNYMNKNGFHKYFITRIKMIPYAIFYNLENNKTSIIKLP